MKMSEELVSVPVSLVRGGTSKGVFIHEGDMPACKRDWGPCLIALFAAEDVRQIDGLGGADQLTSKCCIVGPPSRSDADVDYTFAQVGIGSPEIWWDINCGNLTAGVGVFAVQEGLVQVDAPLTTVRIYQRNTNRILKVDVPVVDGTVPVEGTTTIGGVPGTGAAIEVDFSETVGATLDAGLLPSGAPVDVLDVAGVGPIECSIVDLANACVFFRAEDVGMAGVASPAQSADLRPLFHGLRRSAQSRLGIDPDQSTPWPVAVARPVDYMGLAGEAIGGSTYDLAARAIVTDEMHKAFPGTGGCCAAVAALTPSTVVSGELGPPHDTRAGECRPVRIGHPSGVMEVRAEVSAGHGSIRVEQASFLRTARVLMSGTAFVRRKSVAALKARLDPRDPTVAGVP